MNAPSSQVALVTLSGAYPIEEIDRLLADLSPLLTLVEPAVIEVDLGELTFVFPSTAALLAAALHRCSALGLRREGGRISLPRDQNVKNYLLRMDVLQVALGKDLPEGFKRREAVGFRECQRFESEDESVSVARDLTNALTERCSLGDTARLAIHTCLGELCQNVPHHAATDLGGFASAQGYPGRDRFEAAIVDLGIGIRASLTACAKYVGIADDVSAIEKALELGTTSKPGQDGKTRHSGYGLTVTQHLLQLNGGRLIVRCGRGEVWVGAEPLVEERDVDFPGTLIILEADTGAPLDVGRVYEELLGDIDD